MLTVKNSNVKPLTVKPEESDKLLTIKDYFGRMWEDTFDDMFSVFPFAKPLGLAPIVSLNLDLGIKKNEDGTGCMHIEVPGIKEEDLSIELKNNIIYIKGECNSNNYRSTISRSFTVPETYSSEDISADLSNGLLTLTFKPKVVEEPISKKIAVKSSK